MFVFFHMDHSYKFVLTFRSRRSATWMCQNSRFILKGTERTVLASILVHRSTFKSTDRFSDFGLDYRLLLLFPHTVASLGVSFIIYLCIFRSIESGATARSLPIEERSAGYNLSPMSVVDNIRPPCPRPKSGARMFSFFTGMPAPGCPGQ